MNGGYQILYWNASGGWTAVSGGAVRIAVNPQNNPWIINSAGNIFRRVNGTWQQVPGLARDIAIGTDGSVWIIGTISEPSYGYGIYQWNGSGRIKVNGAAVGVAVEPNGTPWVINNQGTIFTR